MAREKLKDFLAAAGVHLDGGISTENRIAYTIDDPSGDGVGADLGIDPGTQRELLGLHEGGVSEGLLGEWLQLIVDESGNLFTLEPGIEQAASSDRGNVLPAAEEQGVVRPFVTTSESDSLNRDLGPVMTSYSNSGMFDSGENDLSDIIDKTGHNDPRIQDDPSAQTPHHSGHTMLSSIVGEDMGNQGFADSGYLPESILQEQVESDLVRNSRFNPASDGRKKIYSKYPTTVSALEMGESIQGTTTSQNLFGDYDKEAVEMISDELKNVAESLMIKAAGWDKSTSPSGDDGSVDPNDPVYLDNTANRESTDYTNRLIDPAVLRAKNAFGAPSGESGESTRAARGDLLIHNDLSQTRYTRSHGTINTPDTPFTSSTSHHVLVSQAAGAIVAMMAFSKVVFDSVLIGGLSNRVDLLNGPYFQGQARVIPHLSKMQLFRRVILTSTDYPYETCVNLGFDLLFNINFSSFEASSANTATAMSSLSETVDNSPMLGESSGFWLSVARKILRSYSDISVTTNQIVNSEGLRNTTSSFSNILFEISKSGIIDILNVMAVTGDVALKASGGSVEEAKTPGSSVSPFNVDALPDGPATRISKSRSQDGNTNLALAWRGNSVPSMYMISQNIINASIQLNTVATGQNPLKGLVGSSLIKDTYIDPAMEGQNARIPSDVVERMENFLDAEYVPFYFHDLRTNEIVSFHAFITQLGDSYNPRFTSTAGYGRMDPVQTFKSTTRSISLSFIIASTSKTDFDEMWWKINKLTTMIYPQWTQGDKLASARALGKSTFIQPFSQVLGGSPIIRLRVGDVIKGNYSRFNLARLFGIGDTGIKPSLVDEAVAQKTLATVPDAMAKAGMHPVHREVFNVMFASPMALIAKIPQADVARAVGSVVSQLLENGFANPAAMFFINRQFKDPDSVSQPSVPSVTLKGGIEYAMSMLDTEAGPQLRGYFPLNVVYLRATAGYDVNFTAKSGDSLGKWKINRPLKVIIVKPSQIDGQKQMLQSERDGHTAPFKGPRNKGTPLRQTKYQVMVIDVNAPAKLFMKFTDVTHSMLLPNPSGIFNMYVLPFLSIGQAGSGHLQEAANTLASIAGIPADIVSDNLFATTQAQFMQAKNNPITKAFESSRGRGLAGAITRLSFDWMDYNWEIDHNSRAPMAVKVDMSLDVIHDIPPGLDHSGFNRAPIYNVGEVMRNVAGDPYNDSGRASLDAYTNAGRIATVKKSSGTDTPEEG